MTAAAQSAKLNASPWSPFGHRAFAVLWVATVISNVGTWMHDVGAGWLMTELSSSAVAVAGVPLGAEAPSSELLTQFR